MNNKENTKQAWQAPEIIDLDLDKTESGTILTGAEDVYTS